LVKDLQGFEEFVVSRQDALMCVALGLTRNVHLAGGPLSELLAPPLSPLATGVGSR
jgi:hypothetical protein